MDMQQQQLRPCCPMIRMMEQYLVLVVLAAQSTTKMTMSDSKQWLRSEVYEIIKLNLFNIIVLLSPELHLWSYIMAFGPSEFKLVLLAEEAAVAMVIMVVTKKK